MLHVLNRLCFGLILLVCSLQTVRNEPLAWDISRGARVVAGSWTPSKDLLLDEYASEADWLGGLISYGLSLIPNKLGLIVARLAIPSLFLLLLIGRKIFLLQPQFFVFMSFWLLAVEPFLEPTSLVLEMILTVLAYRLAALDNTFSLNRRLICWFFLSLVWANVGGHCLLILFAMVFRTGLSSSAVNWKLTLVRLAMIILGLVSCPRGLFVFHDSFRLLLPWLTEDRWVLEELNYGELLRLEWSPLTIGYLGLGVSVLAENLRRRPVEFGTSAILLMLGVLNRQLITLVATILVTKQIVFEKADANHHKSHEPKAGVIVAASLLMLIMSSLSILNVWPAGSMRMGIGIDSSFGGKETSQFSLLPRLEDSIYAAGTEEAAFVTACISQSNKMRLHDYPPRALIQGRARDWALMNHSLDLRIRETQLTDLGERLGWYLPLKERETRLLAISTDRVNMIRSLEEERWKPLSLTPPVLIFARAGDPLLSQQIVETLKLRTFLEAGPWKYDLSAPSLADEPIDISGILSGKPSLEPLQEQIAVFQAMNMNFAASRIIFSCRRFFGSEYLKEEWLQTIKQQAVQERIHSGRASLFRMQLILEESALGHEEDILKRNGWMELPNFNNEAAWISGIENYKQGELMSALQEMQTIATSEARYACGLIATELGETAAAVNYFEQAIKLGSSTHASDLARYMINKLSIN